MISVCAKSGLNWWTCNESNLEDSAIVAQWYPH